MLEEKFLARHQTHLVTRKPTPQCLFCTYPPSAHASSPVFQQTCRTKHTSISLRVKSVNVDFVTIQTCIKTMLLGEESAL